MQSRELYNQVRDAVKFLKLGVPKIDQWICPVFLTGLKLSEIFAQQKFGLNGIFFNPIPARLWNDVNCRGGAIMAPD